ncbi:MAG TPA: TRCF domain-containing protein, partial [Candidatus Krumholzibacteriaceae bacterium]|nr:TRCF domain-containing protein [Candidatus Krumholzibacteriaceae bacterium]
FLPENYISDSEERMDIYRRLIRATDLNQLNSIAEELSDRFGPIPRAAGNLLRAVNLKMRAREVGIVEADMSREGVLSVVFSGKVKLSKGLLAEIAGQFENRLLFSSEPELSLTAYSNSPEISKTELKKQRSGTKEEDFENLLTIMESYVKRNSLTD